MNTLFVDYYLHDSGCDITALGLTFADNLGNISNNTVVCSEELRHPHFNDILCIPYRVLTHEWSHCYGVEDYYDLSANDPQKCQTDCIMNGGFIDKSRYNRPIENVWCTRCSSIIRGKLKTW